jgi:hypothetical protein
MIAPRIGAGLDRREPVPAVVVGIDAALAAKIRIRRRVVLVGGMLIAARCIGLPDLDDSARDGRPSSSVMRPCTMMRSPSAALPFTTDWSGIGGNRAELKRGPVTSVIVCGNATKLSRGCRLWVLP